MKIIIEGTAGRIQELKMFLASYIKVKNLKISNYKPEAETKQEPYNKDFTSNKDILQKIEFNDNNLERIKFLEIENARLNSIIEENVIKKQPYKKRK